VALSFAGEDRGYVRSVAEGLKAKGVSVFYDEFEEVALWGENLLPVIPAKAGIHVSAVSHAGNGSFRRTVGIHPDLMSLIAPDETTLVCSFALYLGCG